MIAYTFSFDQPHRHLLDISVRFTHTAEEEELTLQLPAWRPGRYELGNFARNVSQVVVTNNEGRHLPLRKITKDSWVVMCQPGTEVVVRYVYYAAELNAGSTFLNEHQLYVNPVNCCMYVLGRINEPARVELDLPHGYEIACALTSPDTPIFEAPDLDKLFDSPFIASPSLQHGTFQEGHLQVHLWFQGVCRPDWPRVIDDFRAFTRVQLQAFGKAPTDAFHFLIQVSPTRAYHGVEHLTSTVIHVGPGYDIMNPDGWYRELVGVCSHELYHIWNVKALRPADWEPYDYTKENYSRLGYVAEGVTTYMGDLVLLQSGYFNLAGYLNEINRYLQRHMDGFGRLHQSIAEASTDLWLDGYGGGAPNRRVSIYTEGCLLAFICDMRIRKASNHKWSLQSAMAYLYQHFEYGYLEEDYWAALEHYAGESFSDIRRDLVDGTASYTPYLEEAAAEIGLRIASQPAATLCESQWGVRITEQDRRPVISSVYPGSLGETCGLCAGDELISINGICCDTTSFDHWLRFFHPLEIALQIKRGGYVKSLKLPFGNKVYFQTWRLEPDVEADKAAITRREKFSKVLA